MDVGLLCGSGALLGHAGGTGGLAVGALGRATPVARSPRAYGGPSKHPPQAGAGPLASGRWPPAVASRPLGGPGRRRPVDGGRGAPVGWGEDLVAGGGEGNSKWEGKTSESGAAGLERGWKLASWRDGQLAQGRWGRASQSAGIGAGSRQASWGERGARQPTWSAESPGHIYRYICMYIDHRFVDREIYIRTHHIQLHTIRATGTRCMAGLTWIYIFGGAPVWANIGRGLSVGATAGKGMPSRDFTTFQTAKSKVVRLFAQLGPYFVCKNAVHGPSPY